MCCFTHVIRSVFQARGCVESPEVIGERVNSRAVREHWYQNSFRTNCWVGLVVYIFVGHYLLPEVSNALRCRPLLDSVLPRLPEEAPLLVRQKFWLQQDAVPAHYADSIWQWLNATSY